MKVVILEEGADLDALSSAYGILLLYDDAYLLKPSLLSRKAGEVFKRFRDKFRMLESLPERFDLVLVDNHNIEAYKNLPIEEIYIYDHHPKAPKGFKGKVDAVGSATTLIVEELQRLNRVVSPEDATILAFGIYEDTGNLTYEGTTERDALALAWLLKMGASLKTIREYLRESLSREELNFLAKSLTAVEKLYIDGFKITIFVLKSEEYNPDFLQVIYRLEDAKDSDAFFVIVSAGSKTYLFGRGLKGRFDTSKVLEVFGGGGHSFASAVKLEDVEAERLKTLLVQVLKGEKPAIKVKDVMNSPPFVLRENMTVEQALLELTERNYAGAPVVDEEGKLSGVVYKKVLLKIAKFFPSRQVKDFMQSDFHTLSVEDFVWNAERILSTFGEKLIPVVEDGKLVGVITRLDLMQAIKRQTEPLKLSHKKIRLSPEVERIAKDVGKVCKELGFRGYLVGGVVRDIVMGKPIWDLDFVIEGDGLRVAERIASIYGVNVHPFPQFGTAHLRVGQFKLEFATTRRETYPHPGAYPLVEPASLKEDLIRRDFTINAMAISVMEEDLGTLIDYFGGLRDMKSKLIRILHPLSFVEDPVRILRALRFAGRFDFKLSKSTEKALTNALTLGVLKHAPKGRLLNELKLVFREEKLLDILRLYKHYKVMEQLTEDFQWTLTLELKLEKLREVIAWHRIEFGKDIEYGWLYLILLLENVKGEDFLVGMSAPGWVRELYSFYKTQANDVIRKLQQASKPSEVYLTLKKFNEPFHLLIAVDDRVRQKVVLYMEKLSTVKVDLSKFKGLEREELGKAIEMEKLRLMDEGVKI
ncbi:CBS domain-containing protein [Thermocrinis sp.]